MTSNLRTLTAVTPKSLIINSLVGFLLSIFSVATNSKVNNIESVAIIAFICVILYVVSIVIYYALSISKKQKYYNYPTYLAHFTTIPSYCIALAFSVEGKPEVVPIIAGVIFLLSISFNAILLFLVSQILTKVWKELPESGKNHPTSDKKTENTLHNVIEAVSLRAQEASKMTSISLVIMVAIVFIGGSASMGTLLLDEIKKINKLDEVREEYERSVREFDRRYNALDEQFKTPEFSAELKYALDYSRKNDSTYNALLIKAQNPEYIHWQEIVLRATIAVLTLFLVQIFFQIYKYSQQQGAYLSGKAELLELYKDIDVEQKDLRTGLLSKIEKEPRFGKEPASPAEQILNVFKK